MADRTIQIIIDTRDRATGSVKAIAESLLKLDQTAQRLANRFKSFSTSKYMATLALIDSVTEPASRINSLLKRIAGGAWRVSLSLSDGALAGVRKIESALMRLTNRVYNIKTGVSGGMGNLTSGLMMGAGVFAPVAGMAGVGFGVSNAISAYAGFEKQMSRVQAIRQLDKNSAEMQAIVQQAKDLGATTAWTRQQVGEAQEYQALAGWKTEQILAATPHMLNLATAAGTTTKDASDIVTDTMTAFGLNATESYRNKQGQLVSVTEGYIDMMAKIQAISNTDVLQAGGALKYAAPVLGTIGRGKSAEERMQIAEDALIMTGLMADAGIKDSMAGTSLRAVFSRFAGQQRNALFSLRGLGVEVERGGEMLMPGEIMRNLRQKVNEGVDPNQLLEIAETFAGEKIHADTRRKLDSFIENTVKNGGKIGSADLMKMATMLGGQEAMSGLLAILSGDWDAKAAEMDRAAGTAKEMANIMLDNLAGSFTILGSAWDNFQQNLMEGKAGDGLRDFVNTLTDVINRADKLFSDGIQIGDFGNLIGDVIDRLKKKFLEFDGIGSVLAGGALIAGLTKIFTTAQKTLGVLRGVQSGTSSVGGTAAAKVGTMNVSAGVVNVNGKVGGAGGAGGGGGGGRKVGDQRIIDRYNRERERIRGGTPPPPPSRFAGVGSAAAGGAAFAAVFSAMDILAVRTQNAERLAQAAPEERAQVIKENRALEFETNSGAIGSILGAAIGAGLGSMAGPMGTAIGGVVGGMIGDAIGRILGKDDGEDATPAQADKKESAPSWASFRENDDRQRLAQLNQVEAAKGTSWEGIQLGSSARR
ncbi:MAG: phage tail tape measure protein, partial [Selenomonadaceae bacterium]|nr:phage tail tape measure protein [Selenomonadaceae bacterium]